MKLLVGLGNPGPRYAGNRHNVGFMAIEAIADRLRAGPFRAKFHALAAEAAVGGEKVLLLLPQTYMNESGRSVGEAARFHKIELADIAVFHDELDLAPGRLRVKRGGGDAGHNGLRSITAHLGAAYLRVRMGIGHPGVKELVSPYVLSDFAKAERPWVEALCAACADRIDRLLAGDEARFQSDVAMRMAAAGFGDPVKERPARDGGEAGR